jgi:hypothetical protein
MMIGTQSRHPCRAVQLGEALLLKNPVSPCLIHLKLDEEHCRSAASFAYFILAVEEK